MSVVVVLIEGHGLVSWTADGVRKTYPFPSTKASRRRFRVAVDQAALAARSTSPEHVARKLVEAFPGAEVRE
ncbi:MAG: hypothetical protein H0U37_07330 [Chloroflexi bacterium]|nr:hypothetical protein [Chloroflexota bacterium]